MCCPIVQHYLIGRRFEFWLVWLISSVRAILAFTCKAKYQDWSLIYLLTTYISNKYSPEDNSQRRLPMVCEIRPWRRWFVTLDKMYGKCKGWICRRSKSVYNSCSSILKTSKIFVFFQLATEFLLINSFFSFFSTSTFTNDEFCSGKIFIKAFLESLSKVDFSAGFDCLYDPYLRQGHRCRCCCCTVCNSGDAKIILYYFESP